MSLRIRSTGEQADYADGQWQFGVIKGQSIVIDGDQVVGGRQPAIATPAGGQTVDAEARAALMAILASLRSHGLIEN